MIPGGERKLFLFRSSFLSTNRFFLKKMAARESVVLLISSQGVSLRVFELKGGLWSWFLLDVCMIKSHDLDAKLCR